MIKPKTILIMGWSYRKRINVIPGVRLNISKKEYPQQLVNEEQVSTSVRPELELTAKMCW